MGQARKNHRPAGSAAGTNAPEAGLAPRPAGASLVPAGWRRYTARAVDGREVAWVAPAASGGRPLVRWLGAYGRGPSLGEALAWELGPVARARSCAIPRDGCRALGGVGLLLDPARAHLGRAVPRDCWAAQGEGRGYVPTRFDATQTRSWRLAFAWAGRPTGAIVEPGWYVEALVGFDRRAVVAAVLAMAEVPPEVAATGLPVVRWADLWPGAGEGWSPEPDPDDDGHEGPPAEEEAAGLPRGWVFAVFGKTTREVCVWAPRPPDEYPRAWYCGQLMPPGWRRYHRRDAADAVWRARTVAEGRAALRRVLRADGWRGDIGAWPLLLPTEALQALDSDLYESLHAVLARAQRFKDATSAAKYAAHALAALLREAGAYAAARRGGWGGGNES